MDDDVASAALAEHRTKFANPGPEVEALLEAEALIFKLMAERDALRAEVEQLPTRCGDAP